MKATKIRTKTGLKTSETHLALLTMNIVRKCAVAGCRTEATVINSTSIKIGLHMCSFRIETKKIGYNARVGGHCDSPKGYKRTDVPTWDQRVEFNDIVNECFNSSGLTANIKSGCYTIRSGARSFNESDWSNQKPTWMGYSLGYQTEIVTEPEARESCDSDAKELAHKEKLKPIRLAQAKARREKMKVFNAQSHVYIHGLNGKYTTKNGYQQNKLNGTRITKDKFYKIIDKLGKWEAKTVRKDTINATWAKAVMPKLSLVGAA